MDMAELLKRSANVLVGISLLKLVAGDLRAEVRHDAAEVGARSKAALERSPYRAAGAAAALGVMAGWMIGQRRRPPSR